MIAQQVNFGFGLLTVGINSQRRVGVGLSGEGGGGEESDDRQNPEKRKKLKCVP